MYSKVYTAALTGIACQLVSVEADVSDGLPQFHMVGYLTSEVKEAQDRVRTAIRNSGYRLYPKRIMVNMAPADIRKSGSGFDLPVAIAVMAAYACIPLERNDKIMLVGELGLDGRIHGVRGILGMVMEARRQNCRKCIVPYENMREGAVIGGITVYGAHHLREVADYLSGAGTLESCSINMEEILEERSMNTGMDFSDIRGQHLAKRCAEIAASGMHNLLLCGSPGAGKSMIAQRISGILPSLDLEEVLEVTQIHSVAGLLPKEGIVLHRPFRTPHHTATAISLAGGGGTPRPGEISLAHRGVLYLDEIPEFHPESLEILRQPLEEGEIHITRNAGQYVFPADFMLVASRNPCRCGYYPDRSRCGCSENDVRRYLQRISRPLLDRIDLYVQTQPVQYSDLISTAKEESSEIIRGRVLDAHEIQKRRYEGSGIKFNSQLSSSSLKQYCVLEEEAQKLLESIFIGKGLSARGYHRIIKTARTIADLDHSDEIQAKHISEAALYRPSELLS